MLLTRKLRVAFLHEKVFMEMRDMKYGRDIDTAFRVLSCRLSHSWGRQDIREAIQGHN
jgi:hypothetical protein